MTRQGNRWYGMGAAIVAGVAVLVGPWTAAWAGTSSMSAPVLDASFGVESAYDSQPHAVTDGSGVWVVVWSSHLDPDSASTDSDIFFARSTDNGSTWSTPRALNTNADTDSGNDAGPQAATDRAGHWIVVWGSDDTLEGTVGVDDDVFVSRSSDNGTTWSAPQALNTNAGSDGGHWDGEPQVGTDEKGHWVTVWSSTNQVSGAVGVDWDIWVSRSTDNGATWTAPQALNSTAGVDSGQDFYPQIRTDRAGQWVTVWDTTDTMGGTVGNDGEVLVSRSTDNGATWTPVQTLNTNAGSDSACDRHPQLTTDGAGRWVAVWESSPLGTEHPGESDVLTARSVNGGGTWTAPRRVNSDTGTALDFYSNGDPQIATDGRGHWVAVWVFGTASVLGARSTDCGTTWTDAEPVTPRPDRSCYPGSPPQVGTDGAGQWMFVWAYDEAYTGSDIWVALMNRSTDTDGDGLADTSETGTGVYVDDWDAGTDPALTDTDGDTLPDGWEATHGLDPNDDGTLDPDNGAEGDPDGNGRTNAEEFVLGTDPTMPLGGSAALGLTAAALGAAARRRLIPRRLRR